jgi:transcription antitermination factor NusG
MGQKMPMVAINLQSVPKKPAWYTVVTKFNYEQKYAKDLLAGLKNSPAGDSIFEVVVPFKEHKEIVKDSKGKEKEKVTIEKIMPLYVFVKAEMNDYVWNYLRNTAGAATILAAGGIPLVMTEQEITKIKEACGILEKEKQAKKEALAKQSETFKQTFKIGKEVKLSEGVFLGYTGKIMAADFNKQKLTISLDANGMSVEVGMSDVEI